MKLFAPLYYRDFKCIADKCEHSCCIGWEIDIDAATLKKYEGLSGGYGDVIKNSISYDGDPHFKLCHADRCPHLNENGLCKIILGVGEDHLCAICREHPRFYNFSDVAEVGIGMSCAEAARIILSSQSYATYAEVGEIDADADEITFDSRVEREKIYKILQDTSCDYTERLNKIHKQYDICIPCDEEIVEALDSLEYLDESHRELFKNFSWARRQSGKDEYLERFLAYFIYRHCTEALDYDDFCSRLSFCFICEQLFSSILCKENDAVKISCIISEEIEYSPDNTYALMP